MRITWVQIGSDERPASLEEVKEIRKQIREVENDPNLVICTNHRININQIDLPRCNFALKIRKMVYKILRRAN